ncbi:UNVERIFIED_CONTAM: hypothetical protein NCL1_54312 [Trichonephila clavipes]
MHFRTVQCSTVVSQIWMACDAEDCGFQMLNGDEIEASVQEESDPVDYETDEDEDNNNNESSKGPSKAVALVFCVRDSYGVLRTTIRVMFYSTNCCSRESETLLRKREGAQRYSKK